MPPASRNRRPDLYQHDRGRARDVGAGFVKHICVGLLNALYKYKRVPISPGRLAEEAACIEIDVLKRPIGKQDHYAAAFGGLNYFVFHADRTVTVKPIIVSTATVGELFESMMSFWTKETRPSESVLTEQESNTKRNTETLYAMRRQADELVNLLYNRFTVEQFGRIIHEGWMMKRGLASKISSVAIDRCYDLALRHGAYGGKVSGAGGGGFLNLFAPVTRQQTIAHALQQEGLLPYKFNFEARGTAVMKFD